MATKPAFLVNFNAEVTVPYHNEPIQNDQLTLLSGNGLVGETRWKLTDHDATVTEVRARYDDISAIRMTTSVCNDGALPLTVDTLSSLFVDGIGEDGPRWYDARFILHYVQTTWQGEAQWRHESIEDLGIYPSYNHGHQRNFSLRSVGSWTTARYYPIVLLEDTATNETHYFELHSSSSWYIEVGIRGYMEQSSLCVLLSAAHEDNDGWYVTLAPGESYTAVPAVHGTVKGGFEEAIAELTRYKRMTSLTAYPDGHVPVCFNDYMNCLWAQPSRERLLPLIEAAADAGCEYFVIDDGWFSQKDTKHYGDWHPCDALFGEGGLRGILKEITDRGMKPGVWLEVETVDSDSDFATVHPEALLTRRGYAIGGRKCFMDFRQPVARNYIMQVFDNLYEMGVRYVKNDYNHTTGASIDAPAGVSGASALDEHIAAFLSLIDTVIATHPDLVIENCGSGAMRCEHGTLSHFHLQSTTDQEYYDRYPSIAQGMLALMPPERAGIWSYPYPVDFHLRGEQAEIYPIVSNGIKEMIAEHTSGWQTAFNMVTGMMGVLYLSGRICYADDLNASLIREAVSIYKESRSTLAGAVPVYPSGLWRLSESGHTSLGLLNCEAGKLLLGVWQMRTEENEVCMDLSKHLGTDAAVVRAYPRLDGFSYSLNDGYLTVTFPVGNCAGYFEICI